MNLLKSLAPFPFFILVATLALASICHAQNSPQDYLNAHNRARNAVGVGNIWWDAGLAAYAQRYANQRRGDCALWHSGGPYGENIAVGGGSFSGVAAVNLWVSERAYYHHNSNTCTPGRVCGHYTQVVWRNTLRVGCARVQCNSGWYFVICSYDPPGNWPGQWPFLTSDQTYVE